MTSFLPSRRANRARRAEWIAVVLAAIGAAGSVYLSAGMGLRACPLCLYQRAFVLATLGVLLAGFAASEPSRQRLGAALALPAAFAGLAIALYHVSLELAGKMECPAGIFGLGTAPQQSLAIQAAIALATGVAATAVRNKTAVLLTSLVFGVVAALACIRSTPPPPAPVAPGTTQPLLVCTPVTPGPP